MANIMGMNQGMAGGMNPLQSLPQAQNYKKQSGARDFFLGNKGGFFQTSRYDPQQSNAVLQVLQNALGMINPQAIEQQATNRFHQQIVPGLLERFSSLGNNALSSSALGSQLGQAGANANVDIQALLSQLGTQLLPFGLTQLQDTHYQNPSEGFLSKLLGTGLQAGGMAAGGYLGNMGVSNALKGLMGGR